MRLFEPWAEINWIDQAAHVAAGYVLTTLFYLTGNFFIAVELSMGFAVIREITQHFCKCGDGCRTDLAFWFIGSVFGGVVAIAISDISFYTLWS